MNSNGNFHDFIIDLIKIDIHKNFHKSTSFHILRISDKIEVNKTAKLQ